MDFLLEAGKSLSSSDAGDTRVGWVEPFAKPILFGRQRTDDRRRRRRSRGRPPSVAMGFAKGSTDPTYFSGFASGLVSGFLAAVCSCYRLGRRSATPFFGAAIPVLAAP